MLVKMDKKNIPLVQSFRCAIKGLFSCFKTERNFRIHLCALFYVIWFSRFYDFSRGEKALLAITVGFVIVSELLNTAIETVVDLVSPEKNTLAGLAKDISAGGVLFSAFTAIAVGFNLFFDKEVTKKILATYIESIPQLVFLIITVVFWALLIFMPNYIRNKKEDKNDQ